MNTGTYAIYTINVSKNTHTVRNVLKQFVPESTIEQSGESMIVPYLLTFWRGDAEEQAWQADLRHKLKDADESVSLIIESTEWTMPEGYPQGDLSL